MNKIKVPGKLFISGEYAAVSAKYHALLVPVNRYLIANIEHITDSYSVIRSNERELKIDFVNLTGPLSFDSYWSSVIAAVKVSRKWLLHNKIPLHNFSLIINSDLTDPRYGKIGLGSSGAVTVATIKAVLSLFKIQISNQTLYKLGINSQKENLQTSSYGDIAVASFQKPLYYQKPTSLYDIAKIETFSWPKNWRLLVGFTGQPFETLKGIQKFELLSDEIKNSFCKRVDNLTNLLYQSLKQGNNVQKVFQKISDLYWNFDQDQHIGLFTPSLKKLVLTAKEFNVPAKQSGAGGGDCRIAIVEQGKETSLMDRWRQENIIPLNLEVIN